MTITAAEQFFIELTNRARLDPEGEAARLGIDLNEGLSAGTLDGSAKQVLAPNALLNDAAQAHSEWMLAEDVFAHYVTDPNEPGQRMADAGYSFYGSWTWGENISWRGMYQGSINLQNSIQDHFDKLFLSEGHRENTLNSRFREFGIAQVRGDFVAWNQKVGAVVEHDTSMLTTVFAKSGTDHFLTGVAYDDLDSDEFYSMGEGTAGIAFSVGAESTTTQTAGGYALALDTSSTVTVSISGGGTSATVKVDMSEGNAKLDLVDGDTVLFSRDGELVSGVDDGRLLGVADLHLTGHSGDNDLTGNAGRNLLQGNGGADKLDGLGEKDTLKGGDGDDTLDGGFGKDKLYGGKQDDLIRGDAGYDTIKGGSGSDEIDGGDGQDNIGGGSGKDVVEGGQDDDKIWGGDGWDTLNGGSGDDTLNGGNGNDRIIAGGGDDVLSGNSGSDTFVFNNAKGAKIITDFDATAGDFLDLDAVFGTSAAVLTTAEAVAGGVLIDDGADFTLFLEGVSLGDLDPTDFV